MREKSHLKLQSLDNSVMVRHSRRLRAEMESLRAVTRNPLKDLHTQVVNPLKGFHVQTELARDPLKEYRTQMAEVERMVNPLRDLRVQTELARDPLKEYRDRMGQLEKSIVNFTHILDEIVKPTIPFISKRSIGLDVFIEPEYPEIGEQPVRIHCPDNPTRSLGEKVFIVCGKDEEAKQTMARWVEKWGLEVVIIDEKPSGALTRIEKVERYSDDVTFTVVLLTPDDVGKPKDELGESNFRASQDVILQLGLLIGKYGRDQICFLYKGELELPSDMDGINLIPMDANGGWILNLIREMQFSGLFLDMSKAI